MRDLIEDFVNRAIQKVVVAAPIPAALARRVDVYVPAATVFATVTVTTACVAVPVNCAGAADAFTPAGRPSTVTLTGSAKPPPRVRVTVTVPLPP